MKNKIALVDDDQNILTSVQIGLEAEDFEVATYTDGETALEAFVKTAPDLIVLDMKMPRMNGMEVLTKLRNISKAPVIFLTSVDEEVEQILAFRMGADDYITKPFSQKILIERIRSLLRRQKYEKQDQEKQERIIRGHLELDDTRHLCTWKGKSLNLTVTEYMLLKTLAMRPGHVKNRNQLIDQAYGDNIYIDDRTVDSHIKRVRKKFKVVDNDFNHIETLYGVGYRYKEDE